MGHSPPQRLGLGSLIADTYRVEALIGRGGMGEVFLASHQRLPGKQVAIKVLHAELSDPEVIARFKREAQIASSLGHPNIVGVDDYNVTPEGTPYLILEYLRGESLAARLRAGPMPLEPVLAIMRQVGSALAAAHRGGIVHRDLKPQNIFLVQTEVDGHVVEVAKVLDFGISKILGSQTVKTQENTLLGTPQYMAPEQAIGNHAAVDERTDLFALGAIAYEMLAGHPAFSGASIPEVVFKVVYEQPVPLATAAPTVPAPVVAAIEAAMTKASTARPANVGVFIEALTGRPLVRAPLRDGGAAGGELTSVQPGAFAATVDSGAGISAPLVPLRPTREPADALTDTVVSQPGAARIPVMGAPAATAPPVPLESAVAATKPRSRTGVRLAVLGVLALGAGAAVFATRRDAAAPDRVAAVDPRVTAPHALPPGGPPTIAPVEPPAATPPAAQSAPAETSMAPSPTTPPKTKATTAVRPAARVAPAVSDDPDPEVRKHMTRAIAALARANFRDAIGAATAVLNVPTAGADQLERANTMIAVGYCKLHDVGRANAYAKQVKQRRNLQRIKRACESF